MNVEHALILLAVSAVWDTARRWIASRRFNQAVLDRIAEHEKKLAAGLEAFDKADAKHQAELRSIHSAIASRQPGPPHMLRGR